MGGTHEDYLAAVATAVCRQCPATADALSEVQVVFGAGPRRRGLGPLHRVWGSGEPAEPLPLVEIAAIGGLSPAEPCYVVLHELAHVLALGFGHGRVWRYAARQVGLLDPRAGPSQGELADWRAISPAIRSALQAIPEPIEPAPVGYYYDWHRRGCGARGMGRAGAPAAAREPAAATLKVICRQPGCGYQVRVTRKWLARGAPRCPRPDHGDLVLERTTPAG